MPIRYHRQNRQEALQRVKEKETQSEVDEVIVELQNPPLPLFDEDGFLIDYDYDSDLLPPLPPPPLDLLGLDFI